MAMKNKLVLIGGIVVVGVGAAAFFAKDFLTGGHDAQEVAAADHQHAAPHSPHQEGGKGHGEKQAAETRLDPFVVNLADQPGRRYLRTTLQLVLHQPQDKERVEQATPRVRDAVLLLLSSKRAEELLTVEGKTQLREEILKQINTTIGKETVAAVYFVDFLIQ
ncbi:MAG: flagellar basal body-associated FliL family protein [Candidatus Binatia bacterium]|nr:flagellar basal body-associated FliL family protein [Candidatus Binatia bacterium]